ncbi:hypothetical protein DS837_28260 [Azospirillum brasilense]|uniref:Uncharacterized protein n=2 Tax=Azospirillum brasilense TaxID=192 RepID=A0A6L3ATA8_AZOBR|nr:hypothetical protein DS837_28260 [Azospirillum brasilense]
MLGPGEEASQQQVSGAAYIEAAKQVEPMTATVAHAWTRLTALEADNRKNTLKRAHMQRIKRKRTA